MVAKREKCVRVFVEAYSAAAVFVKSFKKSPPCREEAPEATVRESVWPHIEGRVGKEESTPKLFKADCPIPIRVEHPDHHSYSLLVKVCKVSIDQRCPEFIFRKLPSSPFVHGFEEGK